MYFAVGLLPERNEDDEKHAEPNHGNTVTEEHRLCR